jgi:hypothetical protein
MPLASTPLIVTMPPPSVSQHDKDIIKPVTRESPRLDSSRQALELDSLATSSKQQIASQASKVPSSDPEPQPLWRVFLMAAALMMTVLFASLDTNVLGQSRSALLF